MLSKTFNGLPPPAGVGLDGQADIGIKTDENFLRSSGNELEQMLR